MMMENLKLLKIYTSKNLNNMLNKNCFLKKSQAHLMKGSIVKPVELLDDGYVICEIINPIWIRNAAHTCGGYFDNNIGYYVDLRNLKILN
jgi:hypothetical protein